MKKRALWFGAGVAVAAALSITLVRTAARAGEPGATSGGCQDLDGDGFGGGCGAGRDCNDRDPAIHPGARETCNFTDDDCDGLVDEDAGCEVPALEATPIRIPAGSFLMGSDRGAADERPVHRVTSSAFSLDRYEVTNARYGACVRAGACTSPSLTSSTLRGHYFDGPAFADYPVIFVSWKQAAAFCAFAGGRLPTEAEWERAAAGDEAPRTYPWGEAAPDCGRANFAGCVGDTDRVGRRTAGQSPHGAFDMAGNVWEWTADWYGADYYRQSLAHDPTGPAHGSARVMRGGCWVSGSDSLRTTCRKPGLPESWAPNVGFRCAYPEARP